MRYGIIVNGRVTEPTDIPQVSQGSPLMWLKEVRGTLGDWNQHPVDGGWVLVSPDALAGAIFNSPGNSTNPVIPSQTIDPGSIPKTQSQFEEWAISRLGSVQAWQNLLEKCAAHIGSTGNDREVRYFPRWTQISGQKTKSVFQERCLPLTLVSPTPIISAAALTAALESW